MTREEALNVLLEIRPCIIDNAQEDALDIAIDALSKLSLPSGLDEAAKKCVASIIYEHGCYDGDFLISVCEDIFKAGAEWMAGQGETYDCRVLLNGLSQYKIVQQTVKSFKPDEIVTVQIRKND